MGEGKLKLDLGIPFENEREAEIAFEVLRVDQEPPSSQVMRSLAQKKNVLNVCFSAPSAHQLRIGVNGFLEVTTLLLETLECFGPPASTCTCSFGLYVLWAVIPDPILHMFGITYYPQKYWAVAVPIYVLMGTAIFAFFIYPCLNLLLTPPLNSTNTIANSCLENKKSDVRNVIDYKGAGETPNLHGIPAASDISISEVCRTLYLNS